MILVFKPLLSSVPKSTSYPFSPHNDVLMTSEAGEKKKLKFTAILDESRPNAKNPNNIRFLGCVWLIVKRNDYYNIRRRF